MAYPKNGQIEPMSAVEASFYVRRMIHHTANGPGEAERSMKEIDAAYGIGFWTLDHLRKGKAKTCDVSLFARIRAAYLDLCERQVARLQHEIAIEKAISGDDDLGSLEAEAASLAARLQAKKARMK